MDSYSKLPPEYEDFDIMVEGLRQEIRNRFQELIFVINMRETEMLRELESMVNPYREQRKKQDKKMKQLKDLYTLNDHNIHSNDPSAVEGNVLKSLDDAIKELQKDLVTLPLKFSANEKLLQDCRDFGEIIHMPKPVPPPLAAKPQLSIYSSITQPIYGVSYQGDGVEELNRPWGIAIDFQSKNIYIADQSNNRVQVFDSDGRYLLSYLVSSGMGQMRWPICLAIHQDKLFVSQHGNDCVTVFGLRGSFINQFGKSGKKNGEFNSPRGIAVQDDSGDIFVCDNGNHRVQIFSGDFKFKTKFGKFKRPLAINLCVDTIIVLDEGNPCIHLYNFDLKLRKRLITLGGAADVQSVRTFCLDAYYNLLLTDYNSNAIRIFNHEGVLIHQITQGVKSPVGITLDTRGRIVLVSHRPDNCLQFF